MISKQLINLVIKISKNAGKSILEIYNNKNKSNEVVFKNDNSPLTLADKASNEVICNSLIELTPEIPILSEEGKSINYRERKQWKKFWLIDPLDGTKEFIKKNGEFTVNIALIDNNTPLFGVVHAPVLNTTWYGAHKIGSYRMTNNNKPININVEIPKTENTMKVVSSRSHSNNPKLNKYLKTFHRYELVKMGSSIKICLVADGSAHVYPRFGPTMEWDTAAAHAVVKYAGGKILNLNSDNEELKYNKKNLLNPEFLVNYN